MSEIARLKLQIALMRCELHQARAEAGAAYRRAAEMCARLSDAALADLNDPKVRKDRWRHGASVGAHLAYQGLLDLFTEQVLRAEGYFDADKKGEA